MNPYWFALEKQKKVWFTVTFRFPVFTTTRWNTQVRSDVQKRVPEKITWGSIFVTHSFWIRGQLCFVQWSYMLLYLGSIWVSFVLISENYHLLVHTASHWFMFHKTLDTARRSNPAARLPLCASNLSPVFPIFLQFCNSHSSVLYVSVSLLFISVPLNLVYAHLILPEVSALHWGHLNVTAVHYQDLLFELYNMQQKQDKTFSFL